MRIYRSNKQKLIKLSITKQGLPQETITLSDAEFNEVFHFVKKSVPEIALSTPQGYRTSITVREYEDGKFGRNQSTSLYGSDPADVKEFLEEKIASINKLPLPSFLYESDGDILTGVRGDSPVTAEWNKFVNKYI